MKVHATQFVAAAEPFLNRTRLRPEVLVSEGIDEVTRNSLTCCLEMTNGSEARSWVARSLRPAPYGWSATRREVHLDVWVGMLPIWQVLN